MIRPTLAAATLFLTVLLPCPAEAQSPYLQLWSKYRGVVGMPGIAADGESFYAFVAGWDEARGERVSAIRHYSMDGEEGQRPTQIRGSLP